MCRISPHGARAGKPVRARARKPPAASESLGMAFEPPPGIRVAGIRVDGIRVAGIRVAGIRGTLETARRRATSAAARRAAAAELEGLPDLLRASAPADPTSAGANKNSK